MEISYLAPAFWRRQLQDTSRLTHTHHYSACRVRQRPQPMRAHTTHAGSCPAVLPARSSRWRPRAHPPFPHEGVACYPGAARGCARRARARRASARRGCARRAIHSVSARAACTSGAHTCDTSPSGAWMSSAGLSPSGASPRNACTSGTSTSCWNL